MEKIRINAIDKKDSGLVIVKYFKFGSNGEDVIAQDRTPVIFEATLNTKWQSQEVDYLEKDVGIGGEVEVEIVQKGRYTNITKVNFKSAVRGGQVLKEVQQGERSLNGQEQIPTTMEKQDVRGKSIIAQCLVKAVMRDNKFDYDIKEAVDMYKEALELLG